MPRRPDEPEYTAQGTRELGAEGAVVSAKVAERFTLEALLGKGASGAVYRAVDRARGATIAIKFLTALDPGSLFRFKSEFRTLANLAHPNLLQLYELLAFDGDWLLTMELIQGQDFLAYVRGNAVRHDPTLPSLATRIGFHSSRPTSMATPSGLPDDAPLAGAVDESRLRSALFQLSEGLQALHREDRLHRDLKPANVLVSENDERVVICDFGLAIEGAAPRRGGSEPPPGTGPGAEAGTGTRLREVAGTLPYMSPEQAQAQALTPASDWYSVGVMLYQALTGRVPFSRSLPYSATVRAKVSWRPIPPAELFPGAPTELADLALALLRPDPAQRAGYAEVMAALEGGAARRETQRPSQRVRYEHALVGREAQTAALMRAFTATRSGSAAIALVSGVSGVGKSALVHDFLARLIDEADAVVLRSRCYEREELPYKALDSLMDALSSHLLTLPDDAIAALVPPSLQFLAALFPALRRVPAIAALPDLSASTPDPRERRRLAFRAFGELCRRLVAQRPLVLFIDDLQWGDLDSAPLFHELLTPQDAPAVLIACAYRSDHERRSPLLALLRDAHSLEAGAPRLFEVSVGPLAPADATRLALDLLAPTPSAAQAAELIAREAEGNPFFVRELAAYANEHGFSAASRVRLDALIVEQLEALPRESRELLSVVAVAGRPVAHTTIRSASGLGPAMFKALRDLETRRLVSTSRTPEERVECSHDRIREAVCKAVSRELPALHRALAEALEREPVEDCDALLEHWRSAGERERASHYAERGARKAELALAFTRAADLYRQALTLLPPGDTRLRALSERLGYALILAGRGPEAANVFLSLLPDASAADALKFRMLAATQLLRGGKLAQAFEELKRADDLFGVRFPESEAKAVTMLLTRKLRIRLRERRIDPAPAVARLDAELGARLDTLWEVAAAVSNADLLRGSVYGAELMLRATQAGDPAHIAGACGLQAIAAVAADDTRRGERMIELAAAAGHASGQPHVVGRVTGMQAICRQLQGRWLESIALARRSQELHRSSARFSWESAIMLWWEMASASYAGQVHELVTRIPDALREAEARGDVYAATSLRTYRCAWAWLGMDRPDVAELHVDTAEREWTPKGYQFQHWHMTYARAEIDLYRGTPQRSLARVIRAYRRGRLVRQVSTVRSDMLYARARLALSTALEDRRPNLLRLATDDARALIRAGNPWTVALGKLVLAGIASCDDRSAALALLTEVEALFTAADMALHAEIAKVRRGELLGGSDGIALVDLGLANVHALGVKRPERFVQMLAPMASPSPRDHRPHW